ncbi:MAG: hypothetical protein DRP45_12460 [Candidatus Zixiibacteriota bacterium]|nr:MAG: hypothetical protein DRP45_12460 [candidate division Zixibacteria bacterium]
MITVEEIGIEKSQLVLDMVGKLLDELADDQSAHVFLNHDRIRHYWEQNQDRFTTFVAMGENDLPLGMVTVIESFAIYADGAYGVINELYVQPEFRGKSIGKMLLQTVKEYGSMRNWERIDVTTPPGEKWQRAETFYEREDFVHTGPKMKFLY